MEQKESFERLYEGLARAASCCREFGAMSGVVAWKNLSAQLLLTRDKALALYKSGPLPEAQVIALVQKIEDAQRMAKNMTRH